MARSAVDAHEHLLKHLLTVAPVVIYGLHPHGDFATVYISDTIETLLGYRTQDFLEDPCFGEKRVHPDEVARYREAFTRAVQAGAAVLECRTRTRSGLYRWFRHELHLIRDDRGQPAEVVGSMVDVTREKGAEEELRRSEQRLKDFADAASDWFWETDADHRFSYVSADVSERGGVGASAMLDKTRAEIADEDTANAKWQAHWDDLRSRRPFRDFEYRVRGCDGGRFTRGPAASRSSRPTGTSSAIAARR